MTAPVSPTATTKPTTSPAATPPSPQPCGDPAPSANPLAAAEVTAVRNRVRRAQGQLDAVVRMIDEGKDCSTIVTQMVAASKAVDRATRAMLLAGLRTCDASPGPEDGPSDRERMEKLFLSLA